MLPVAVLARSLGLLPPPLVGLLGRHGFTQVEGVGFNLAWQGSRRSRQGGG